MLTAMLTELLQNITEPFNSLKEEAEATAAWFNADCRFICRLFD